MNKFSDPVVSFFKDVYGLLSGKSESFRLSFILLPMLLALLLRLPLLIWPEAIYNDSTVYVSAAKGILRGNWSATVVPPFYPMFLAFANFVTSDFELAGILVSIVFGVLLVIPVFYLGKELYDERVGMVAALLASVQPYLFKYSGSVLTESFYYALVASIVIMALRCFNTGKHMSAALFGALTAIGYLVRPEAVGFLLVFGVLILLFNPAGARRPFMRRVTLVLLAGFCFVALSSPYLLLLRKELGRWELSKKVSMVMDTGEGEDAVEVLPGEAFQKQKITMHSFITNPLPYVKAVGLGFFKALYKFQQSLTPLLFLLMIWGFIRRKDMHHPWKQNLFVLSFIVFFFCFVFPMFKISPRYTSHMAPLALPWAAYGFLGVMEAIRSRIQPGRISEKIICCILVLIMGGLLVQGVVQRKREHRSIQRQAGMWLKHNLPRGEKLMSRTVQEAFYADMEMLYIPKGTFEQVIEQACTQSVRYIVVDEKVGEILPDFWEKAELHGLVLLHAWEGERRKIFLFKIY